MPVYGQLDRAAGQWGPHSRGVGPTSGERMMSKQTSGTVRRWANASAMALGLLSNLAGCCPNAHQIAQAPPPPPEPCPAPATPRSEERRVGKECGTRGA